MKQKISLLDCTLRDGGYNNNWNFGQQAVADIIKGVSDAGIEYIELGFLETGYADAAGYAKFSCPTKADSYIEKNLRAIPVCMLRADRMDVEALPECAATQIQGIRYLFSVDDTSEVIQNIRSITNKGYKLFLQPYGTKYADIDAFDVILDALPNDNIEAVYVVDTYGNLTPEECNTHIQRLHQKLAANIAIGVHLHDNCGLAMANVMHVLSMDLDRHIMIDSCIAGYGRAAGNLRAEEFICNLPFLDYDIVPLLGVVDKHFPLARDRTVLLLTAILNIHPEYGMYLLESSNLSILEMYDKLRNLPAAYTKKFNNKDAQLAFSH